MAIQNCRKCKKIFHYINSPICPECQKAEQKDFDNVRSFIKENNKSTLGEVSEATGVHTKKILRYIREGRLEVTYGLESSVVCEKCGVQIATGRYCTSCANELGDKFNTASKKSTSGIKKSTSGLGRGMYSKD
ncbi:MAG: hypothetical protein ACK5LT_04780 [Lachnospirales bacterium]